MTFIRSFVAPALLLLACSDVGNNGVFYGFNFSGGAQTVLADGPLLFVGANGLYRGQTPVFGFLRLDAASGLPR